MPTKFILSIVVVCTIALAFFFYSKRNTQKITNSDPKKIQHLGIIMDGNRRWAKKRGLAPWLGHEAGIKPLKMSVKYCIQHGIPHLSLYTLSLDNFKRPQKELDYLFDIIAQKLFKEELGQLVEQDVKITFVGNRAKFPKKLIPTIESIEEKTKNCTTLSLNLLFCYGGRQELTTCIKDIAQKVKSGELAPEDITEQTIKNNLWLKNTPDPELVIRTGYRSRLSGFLPYTSVYSELCFLDCFWPEFTEQKLEEAIQQFTKTTRNFGK